MKHITNHKDYGKIVYNESFWLGKKSIMIGNKLLSKIDRKTYVYDKDGVRKSFTLSGNYFTGAKLTDGKETIQVLPSPKWYELFFTILIVAIKITWGNFPLLVSIFPVVGGAIGGAIGAIGACLNMVAMRSVSKVWLKILIGIGVLAGTFLVSYLVATFILTSLLV